MRSYGGPTALANRFSLLTVAMLLAAGIATAQQVEDQLEYNFLGAGARANGMGDAFIAVADDATAIFWNPAGLFLLDQPETSFGFQFASEKIEQERRRQMFLFASDEPGGSVGLNFASFVFPKRFGPKKFVFAFAMQRAFDFKNEFLEIEAQVPFVLDLHAASVTPEPIVFPTGTQQRRSFQLFGRGRFFSPSGADAGVVLESLSGWCRNFGEPNCHPGRWDCGVPFGFQPVPCRRNLRQYGCVVRFSVEGWAADEARIQIGSGFQLVGKD